MMPAALLMASALIVSQPVSVPAHASPIGTRISLDDDATLFVPTSFRPEGAKVDLVLHLHGAPSTIEPALVASKWPGVLVAFNRKGLSSVYSKPFADPTLFPRLLENALKELRDREIVSEPRLGRVVVSSFSAGFGGVREILKVPDHVARIDVLILADSLYCGYEGDPAEHQVDPRLMAGFRDFARRAASGSKGMVVTHSAQVPGGYASTTETADDLIRTVEGVATPAKAKLGDGWVQTREFRKGRLLIRGFEGESAEDHMRHLRRISETWVWAQGR